MLAFDQGTGFNLSGLDFDFDTQNYGELPTDMTFGGDDDQWGESR